MLAWPVLSEHCLVQGTLRLKVVTELQVLTHAGLVSLELSRGIVIQSSVQLVRVLHSNCFVLRGNRPDLLTQVI